MAAVSKARIPIFHAVPAASPKDSMLHSSTAVESLFQNRIEGLQSIVAEMQAELCRATASEAALHRSVTARDTALSKLLHRGATAALHVPQCGPIRVPVNINAEREALRVAVEEQLHWN